MAACRRAMAVACIAAIAAMPPAAMAQSGGGSTEATGDAIDVVVGTDISHDSNLFRQPSSAQRTSDTITASFIGLRLDKQYSLQRFQFDITQSALRYARTSYLNFNALDYRGAWIWQIGSRVSGTIGADRRESLVPFEDVRNPGNPTRNIRVGENRFFNLDARAFADWHLLLGVSESSQTSERAIEIQPDFDATSREAGIRYAPPSGNSIAVVQRSTSGDYVNQSSSLVLGTGYKQDETELKVQWTPTGKSSLNGRLTRLSRSHERAGQRDFSGTAAELIYSWATTGKLDMKFIAKRDIAPYQDPSGSFVVNNTLSVLPTWKITEKTVARLLAAQTTSKFSGYATGPAVGPARSETLRLVELGVDWSPVSRMVIGASVLRQARDSNIPAFAFENTILRITAAYRF
ncbi:MAG: putative exosortase B-associated extracellular polysaccharide biosynthesis transporter EpsL [Burkholderiales bacterium]|nr:putative exosortase B-associated extracellular polysaccharide biosynthesis transporter EpsL [Burkholderiales bacterium]MDP2398588.1 putative exosortase B-associated extracellular polysaccharide biosynthesis transporter EpsL [Burkholderiales bacterium]